jgi:creatinine amidohydrolase/Fe(II)-dependent formamide hydrolase-like protein
MPESSPKGLPSSTSVTDESLAIHGAICPTKLENRIVYAILANVAILTKQQYAILTSMLPGTYVALLNKWYKIGADSQITPELTEKQYFDQLLPLLSQEEQQLVNRIRITHDQPMNMQDVAQHLAQLEKKYWKLVVSDIKHQLHQATQEGNVKRMQHLLQQFTHAKEQFMQPKDHNTKRGRND